MSVQDVFADLVRGEVKVGGEFEPGDGMMGLLAQGGSDPLHEVTAVALAFAGDSLNVLGVNAEAGWSGFHDVSVLATKFNPCMHTATERVR